MVLLQVLAIPAGIILVMMIMGCIFPEKYYDIFCSCVLFTFLIGGMLFALYIMIFEPEEVHDVNEILRTMPKR